MATNTIEAFYLGIYSDLDTFEGDWTPDNSSVLLGSTFGSGAAPLYASIDSLTLNDLNSDGSIDENDQGQSAEPLIYQEVSSNLDTAIDYNVTVTYINGTTATTSMLLLQDELGRVFLAPWAQGNPVNDDLGDKPIESITLDRILGDSFSGNVTFTEQGAFLDGDVDGTSGDDVMGTSYTDADGTQMKAYGGHHTVHAGLEDVGFWYDQSTCSGDLIPNDTKIHLLGTVLHSPIRRAV